MKSRVAAERIKIFLKVGLLISASQCSVARDAETPGRPNRVLILPN